MNTIKGFKGIGGKKLAIRLDNWVLDLTFLPFFVPIFLIPSISLEENSLSSFSVFSHWVTEKILAWGSCLLVWWINSYLITKNGAISVSVFQIWLIGFLGGFIGCGVGEIVTNWLGLTFRLEFFQRMVYTSVSCIGIVMITSILGRGRRSYVFLRNEVKRSATREQIAGIRKSQIYSDHFKNLLAEITNKLNKVVNNESKEINLESLRTELRQFSHELFSGIAHHKTGRPKSKNYFYADFSPKLFLLSVRKEPLNPNIFTLVIAFFVTMPLLRLESSVKSLVASLFAILITFIIHNLQYYYWKFKGSGENGSLIAFDFLNLLALITVFYILKGNFGFYESVTNEYFLFLMLTILYWFFYVLGHISRISDIAQVNQEVVREGELNKAPSLSELLENEEYRIRLEWSKFIHAELQPYLLAMKLSNNLPNLDVQVSEIKSRVANFEKNFVFFSDPDILTLDDCFEVLKNKWDGVLQIIPNLQEISRDSQVSSQAILDLRDILSELAVNAVKHGGADILRVDVKIRESNSLVISAENNGAPLTDIKPGLGSSVFDLLCEKNWSLKNHGGMVVFTCRIYNHQ